jgi:hypothetical protein
LYWQGASRKRIVRREEIAPLQDDCEYFLRAVGNRKLPWGSEVQQAVANNAMSVGLLG